MVRLKPVLYTPALAITGAIRGTSKAKFVGNKAKGRIQNWVLKESKACQIFRKTNFAYFLIRTPVCAYKGVRNVHFRKSWRALFSSNTRLEIHPFALLSTSCAVN